MSTPSHIFCQTIFFITGLHYYECNNKPQYWSDDHPERPLEKNSSAENFWNIFKSKKTQVSFIIDLGSLSILSICTNLEVKLNEISEKQLFWKFVLKKERRWQRGQGLW